ncbi:MAG: hypothetical protein ACP5SI_07930 [Chloroflexia bacterium]
MELPFDDRAWRQALEEEAKLAETIGVEEAVRRTAARFRAPLDRASIARLAGELRRRYRISGEDARAAYLVLEAYHWERAIRRQPVVGRIKRSLSRVLGFHYPRPVLFLPERVVFVAPLGYDCPLLAALGGDLQRCRPFCEAHLAYGILHVPAEMMLVETAGEGVRWEIDEFRATPEAPCYYALSSE